MDCWRCTNESSRLILTCPPFLHSWAGVVERPSTHNDPECFWRGLGWILGRRTNLPSGPAGQYTSIWSSTPHHVGCGPLCFRYSHRWRECHRCHNHLGHAVPSCTGLSAASKPRTGRPFGRCGADIALPVSVLRGAQRLVGTAHIWTACDIPHGFTL